MTRARRDVHGGDAGAPGDDATDPGRGSRDDDRRRRAARRHQLGRPEVTELEVGDRTYRVAEVEPLDVDGVRTIVVGSALWLIAALALLPFYGTLQDSGRIWWIWTCLAGFGLGTIGIEYCRRRRRALSEHPERRRSDTSPLGPAGM